MIYEIYYKRSVYRSSINRDREDTCNMAPLKHCGRKSAVPRNRQSPYVQNWRRQEDQEGIKLCTYITIRRKYDSEYSNIRELFRIIATWLK